MSSAVLSILIAPVYVKFLGLEKMGILAVGQAIASYLVLANGGINASTTILVSHAHGQGDWTAIAKAFRHGVLLSIAAVGLVVAATIGLAFFLEHPTFARVVRLEHPEWVPLILAIGGQAAVGLIAGSFYNLHAGLQNTRQVVVLQGSVRIVGQLLSAGAAVLFGAAYAVVVAHTVATAIGGVLAALLAYLSHRELFSPAPIEGGQAIVHLRTGAKSFGLQVGGAIGSSSPVFSINHANGATAVPTFTLPLQLINVVNNIIVSFAHFMQPAFGEAWSKGDRDWIRQTVVDFMEKIVFLLMVASAGFVAVGAPFIRAWVGVDVSVMMLLSVVIVSSSQTLTAWWRSLLSGINRHRRAAQSEILNGFLILFLTLVICRKSIDALGLGVLLAGAATSYWVLPGEIRRHLDIPRLFPRGRKLLAMAAVSAAVYLSALGVLAMSTPASRVGTFVQVAAAVLTGSIAFVLSASALRLIAFRPLVAKWKT